MGRQLVLIVSAAAVNGQKVGRDADRANPLFLSKSVLDGVALSVLDRALLRFRPVPL